MSLFASLRDLVRPRTHHATAAAWQIPFGLTVAEWTSLKSLQTHEGWGIFLRALDGLAKFDGDKMLQSSDTNVLHFLRGHVSGMRTAGTFIETYVAAEKRHAEDKAKAETHAKPRRDSLFGSPGWRSQRQRDASGV